MWRLSYIIQKINEKVAFYNLTAILIVLYVCIVPCIKQLYLNVEQLRINIPNNSHNKTRVKSD